MSNTRDNHLWLKLWRNSDTDFHQSTVNTLLTRFWSKFDLKQGSRVFIPLCGKSLDILWLLEQGHEVIAVELSPVAVKAFFSENNLIPTKKRMGQFTSWQYQKLTLLCGDFFELTQELLGDIDTVYDRAALTALPEDLREPYVKKLGQITPKTCDIFLLTTEDIEPTANNHKMPYIDEEIEQLYILNFTICLKHTERIVDDSGDDANHAELRLYQLSHK